MNQTKAIGLFFARLFLKLWRKDKNLRMSLHKEQEDTAEDAVISAIGAMQIVVQMLNNERDSVKKQAATIAQLQQWLRFIRDNFHNEEMKRWMDENIYVKPLKKDESN